MALYRETKEGRVQLTQAEEAEIKADWAAGVNAVEPPTLEERIRKLEKRMNALETSKV